MRRGTRGSSVVAATLLVAVAGCTRNVRPVPVQPEAGAMPQVEIQGAVSVSANAADTQPHSFDVSPYTIVVNNGDFAEATLRAMERELGRRGVELAPGGKTLEISVVYVAAMQAVVGIDCVVDYKVTTGNGVVRGVQARGASSWGFSSACDAAVTNAVAEILRDAEIADYLRSVSSPTPSPTPPAKAAPQSAPPPSIVIPTPRAVRPSPPPPRSVEEQLRTLERMRKVGLISPGEYEEKRRIILGTPPQP